MFEAGRTAQVAKEMKNYMIGVLGLSETRWLQTGQMSSGEQLLYSGHTEDGAPRTESVALMLAPEAQRALVNWEPVNSRIITAKFINKMSGKFQQTDKPVKDRDGDPPTTTEEQLKRWAEQFRELLNCPASETPPDIPPTETELPISCDKPTKAEIKKAIMTLRSGKAAGPDEIPAEAIKADMETVTNMLHSLFSKIWEKEEVPAQWKGGIVIKLSKKGNLRDCNNYRGIMLLSVPDKVLNRVLLERMKEAVDPKLRDQQAGFRRTRPLRQFTHHSRAVADVELPSLHQLHTLWEGLRQCGQRDAVEAAEALRSPGEDHRPHPPYLPGHELQDRSRRQRASRSRLESVKGTCCHHFSSFWSSTGS